MKKFNSLENLKSLLPEEIKNKLGIGGSLKKNELYFQGNKRDEIISILARMGHDVKKVGG